MTQTAAADATVAPTVPSLSLKPWSIWASLAILLAAEVSRFGLRQITPLHGYWLTTTQWAWPLLVIVVAVWLARAPLREYLA